jgi:hypothetical protein
MGCPLPARALDAPPSRCAFRAPCAGVFALAIACHGPPPASRFPDAQAALDRMRATAACSRGLTAEAKLDYFGEAGRLRATLLYITAAPDKLRFDIISPFGPTLSTLTSDGRDFALLDTREKQFLRGPANACNLARFSHVPVPPSALLELLHGQAPVLVHAPGDATIAWESGEYVIRIQSKHMASEEIHLVPVPDDFGKNFQVQRVRVNEVRVLQRGIELYRAELAGHRAIQMSTARIDPDGMDPPMLPSGPECHAEIPERLHLEVPGGDQDVILENQTAKHNPPLAPGVFRQEPPNGVVVRSAICSD